MAGLLFGGFVYDYECICGFGGGVFGQLASCFQPAALLVSFNVYVGSKMVPLASWPVIASIMPPISRMAWSCSQ